MSHGSPAYVVTGGTGALGRVLVRKLVDAGARVAVPYTRERGFEELVSAGPSRAALRGGRVDVADPSATQAFVDEAASSFGGLDGLAALAGGYAGSGTLERAPVSEWEAMIRANLDTAHSAARAVLPHLLERGGSIVMVGARLAEAGGAGATAYAVSKAGVHALVRTLALENRARGVRVNCVVPAIIDTPANRRAMPGADVSTWTSPEAIADVIAFLLSPESAAITGAFVPVDARV